MSEPKLEALLNQLRAQLKPLWEFESTVRYDPDDDVWPEPDGDAAAEGTLGYSGSARINEAWRRLNEAWAETEPITKALADAGYPAHYEESPAKCIEAYGLTVVGQVHKLFRFGDVVFAEWDEQISGSGQQHSSAFIIDSDPIGPRVPAVLLHRLGFEVNNGGFPTDYGEAAAWAEEELGLTSEDAEE